MATSNNDHYNICLFTPKQHATDSSLGIINLVYEKHCPHADKFVTGAIFKLCIVLSGTGTFRTLTACHTLTRGDVFLIQPAVTHMISDNGGLSYAFVSFSSTHAYRLIESIGISKTNCFFAGVSPAIAHWEAVLSNTDALDAEFAAQGLVYLTLARIARPQPSQHRVTRSELTAQSLKRIIDERYCDSSFNLTVLAKELFYSRKYVSDLFKKLFRVSFTTYLAELRANNAINLIVSGFTSVKEIAQLSGYDDPLYFSKAFKRLTGFSPTQYIAVERAKRTQEKKQAQS